MLEDTKLRADEPNLLTDDRAELQELYQLTADQNAVLTRQAQVLKEQLAKTEVAVKELHARGVATAKSAEEWRDRANGLEEKLRQVEDQRSTLQRKMQEAMTRQANELQRAETLGVELERAREELIHAQNQAATFKAGMERTAQEAKHDTDKLRNEVTHLLAELDDSRGAQAALEGSVQEQAEKTRLSKREMEVVKQESEQMLKLMESMERKLRDV